jgi:hypothetical protein
VRSQVRFLEVLLLLHFSRCKLLTSLRFLQYHGSRFYATYHSSISRQNILSTSYRRNKKVQIEQKSYRSFRRVDSSNPSGSSSRQVQVQLYFRLHRLQLSSTIFQVKLLAVLPDLSGCNCLLPHFQVQLLLYIWTTQVITVFYAFFQVQRLVLFRSFILNLVINIKLPSLSSSLSIKNLATFDLK